MKFLKWIFIALLIIIILVAVPLFIYLQSLKPTLSGELKLEGLKSEVEVMFDDYGVPHIYAKNEEDAYFALGYVHAQDRLFQMEILRRVGSGRLAEILGPEQLKVDKLFRTLGLNEFARSHAQKFLNSDSLSYQRAAQAYIAGINQYVENGKTPIEFTIMGIPKEKFSPEDIYLVGGLMAFGFAEGIKAEPILQKLKDEFGEVYLADLQLQSSPNDERIKSYTPGISSANNQLIASIRDALKQIPAPLWQGSNGWVVGPKKSASGFPILANDTHMGYAQPAIWYEAHLEYPGFSFYGHHAACVPFGLLGNNRRVGWGLTMFENDDTDFFVETLNPDNPNQVKFREGWEDLTIREEIIKIKGAKDFILKVKTSRHGPIINGILNEVSDSIPPLALCWQFTQLTNPLVEAIYNLNHSQSLAETKEIVSTFTAPGLNVMYGDVDGNIAWWAVARLPIRPAHVSSKLFLDGSSGKDEYLGYYDFLKNPQAINPPWGFVYSSNNQPDSVDGVLYPGYYYPKARALRISQLLQMEKKFSVEDMTQINLDAVSLTAPDVAKEIASVLEGHPNPEMGERTKYLDDVVSYLKEWTGTHELNDVAPSLYYTVLAQIIVDLMQDELGADALKSLNETAVIKNSYLQLIQNESSVWWDDVRTRNKKETRNDIVLKATRKALALLVDLYGNDVNGWTWKKLHTLTHNHPLGQVKPLDKIFSVGPFEVRGGIEVINNLMFDLDTVGYFRVNSGPALRKITDFGDIENGVTVSPTGQSGNFMSHHYSDQAEMFVNGKSRKMMMNREEIVKKTKNKLVLK